MPFDLLASRKNPIEHAILKRFSRAAVSPQGLFAYPTGHEALVALDYPLEFINALPERVTECYCGVGNPFAPATPAVGERVLDVGCGAGVDALVAAYFVGASGCVAGLEFSPDMLGRAKENVRLAQAQTVFLHQGGAECLPFADGCFDRVISNGVYNLVLNKPRALAEAFRVLRPGGCFHVADQIQENGAQQGEILSCPLPPPAGGQGGDAWAC